eukprot:CAMPEP_0206455866 /NCGR_PEP_ID=MMETSP0324_2-20121206/22029_1 /ASSEMBLY_ACC=CAM_ASM_000836 /TAXON_ID=2866 /ORGANISM="Crypthecodinium cohnii, Strain Seligo" /LENGTH=93 /DNA_ID=CAMNT_0053926695 /DNA_START=182 /DNA_END=463 /DNA_ORIENTATION=-
MACACMHALLCRPRSSPFKGGASEAPHIPRILSFSDSPVLPFSNKSLLFSALSPLFRPSSSILPHPSYFYRLTIPLLTGLLTPSSTMPLNLLG